MKRLTQALVVAALFNATYALAEDAPIVLVSKSTYADQHKGELAMGNSGSAFPGEARDDIVTVESKSTYADRAPGQVAVVSAFPGSARDDIVTVESKSTYADNFANERSMQARAASDPALSQ